MGILEYFDDEMITNVKITGLGTITSYDTSGRPVYGVGSVKYNSGGAVWQGSSSQVFGLDRVADPGTYQIVIEPSRITGTLAETDTCEVAVNGVARSFDINIPDDVMGLGEVMQISATLQVLSQ